VSKKTLVRANIGVIDTMTPTKMTGKDTEKLSSEAQSSPFDLQLLASLKTTSKRLH
jgi:hypothetical protein